eukprot:CCRYP_017654-RA/>CCRYP_017654-RA protein AED:0.36 eAED:0.36 QI:0/0/0/0.5/1/1/4/0/416
MPKHFYHRAETQYHPADDTFYDSHSSRRDGSYSYDTALGNHHSFGETDRNANDGYSAARYPSVQPSYDNNAASMPALPSIGVAKSPYFPHSSHSIAYPTRPIYSNSSYFSDAQTVESRMEGLYASASSESSTTSTNPNRPAPAKSAFMCFSFTKREEIMNRVGSSEGDGVVKELAKEWRKLSKYEKKYWDDMARADKTRYAKEKEEYSARMKGKSLVKKLRAKKNPLAPKRPMSAFLMYAQKKRKILQSENPDMPNADISRLLGESWRNASLEEKAPYLEREEAERKIYRVKMDSWKNDQKLMNSLKTPNERKRNLDKVNDPDQREDTESGFGQKYGPTSYNEVGYSEVDYNEVGRDENVTHQSVFSSHSHQQCSQEQFEDHLESRSRQHDDHSHLTNQYNQFPRYSYPRPSQERY